MIHCAFEDTAVQAEADDSNSNQNDQDGPNNHTDDENDIDGRKDDQQNDDFYQNIAGTSHRTCFSPQRYPINYRCLEEPSYVIRDLESSCQEIYDGTFEHVDSTTLQECPALESTSVALYLCKKRVLKPYFRILSLLGWRPLFGPFQSEVAWPCRFFNWFHSLFITCFIITGYVLQYASCFRQDGFPPYMLSDSKMLDGSKNASEEEPETKMATRIKLKQATYNLEPFYHANHLPKCSGNFFSLYLVPDILHFFAYLFVLQLMRKPESERLQNLLERVFIQATRFNGWPGAHKKIVHKLRSFLWISFGWLLLSVAAHALHIIVFQELCFTWMHPKNNPMLVRVMTGVTVLSLTWNDMICAAIVINYSLHCHLNITYISSLCIIIREKRIDFQEFCKRIEESRKFVDYLNNDQALGVSLLLVNFGCRAMVALYGLFSQQIPVTTDVRTSIVVLTSAVLWISLLSVPVFQAARLTDRCNQLKSIGHELRARPFCYKDTSQEDLNSLMLYISSLKLEAKMLNVPIRSSWLVALLVLAIFLILFFGQIGDIKI